MAHNVLPLAPVALDAAPGSTASFMVYVNGATQPPSSTSGTVSVEFDGTTVDTPLTVQLNSGIVSPAVSVSTGSPDVTASVGTPQQVGPDQWQVEVTLTAA